MGYAWARRGPGPCRREGPADTSEDEKTLARPASRHAFPCRPPGPPAPPPHGVPAPAAAAAGPAPNGLGFALFIVLNGSLFIRPAEVVPALIGWEIYQFLILLTLAVSFPAVFWQLRAKALETRPITVFVLGLLGAVLLSHLVHAQFELALDGGRDFLNTVLYYLLFVGPVTTPRRLRSFLWWLTVFTAACTVLALLQYHQVIMLPQLNLTKDGAGSIPGPASRTSSCASRGPAFSGTPMISAS